MVDRRKIVQQWRRGVGRVLVTLVRAEGSSYRKPGAHLLIGDDAEYAGTISGGCLEAEVVRKASWTVREGATVQRYSTLFDDTAEMPFGLGCGGVVDLLLEPLDTPECKAFLSAMEGSLEDREATVVTLLPNDGTPLCRAVFDAAGVPLFHSAAFPEVDRYEARLPPVVPANLSSDRCVYDECVYIERLSAPPRLILFGAGDDAKPVVTMAALMGWHVVVADGRMQLARADRFPGASRVVGISSVGDLHLKRSDCVIVMTHSYEQDRALLLALLEVNFGDPSNCRGFIGLLGARHRSSLLVSEVGEKLGRTFEECAERVCAPVGLDLGGDGPEAIALAIVAQVQAFLQGSTASFPSLLREDMLPRDASRYLQAQCTVGAPE